MSLEYLLLLIGLLAFLSASFHFFSALEQDSRFWLDVQSAKGFCSRLQAEAKSLLLMGDGSRAGVEAKILGEWEIAEGEKEKSAILVVRGGNGKPFYIPLHIVARGIVGKTFTKTIRLALERNSGQVLLSLQD